MYGKLAYMYGKTGYFEYFHGLRKQNLPLDVWQLGFLAAGCICFNPGVSIKEVRFSKLPAEWMRVLAVISKLCQDSTYEM